MTKHFRDRIIELRRVPAGDLVPNPRNWRTHPGEQQAALSGVLEEIGYAGALLARERDDGRLELIDGHLRAAASPRQLVPVLVLDVTAAEADKLLLTYDTLAGMAGKDEAKLRALLQRIEPGHPAMQAICDKLEDEIAEGTSSRRAGEGEIDFAPAFQVLVECRDEAQQHEVYDHLTDAGYDCRLMML